jgi:hypothetical protein
LLILKHGQIHLDRFQQTKMSSASAARTDLGTPRDPEPTAPIGSLVAVHGKTIAQDSRVRQYHFMRATPSKFSNPFEPPAVIGGD